MKKILIIGLTQNFGGVESVIMNYYRNFDKKNFEFHFVKNFDKIPNEQEIIKLGGIFHNIVSVKNNMFKYYKQLNQLFKNNKFDVVWFNSCILVNFAYIKYAKKYGVKKIIVHSHNSKFMDTSIFRPLKYLLHKINKRKIFKYATDFWSCGVDASKFFFEDKIINSEKHKIINNAIDLEKFKFNESVREEYRKKLGLKNCYVIGNVGRLHYQKNQKFLVDVFKNVYEKNNNARLLLIGQGEDEQKLKEQVEKLNLQKVIMFLGARNDVPNLLQAMDCFVLPSLYEGLPVVGIEAEASGLKCVFSEFVPKEVKFCDEVLFLPLDKDEWVKELLKEKTSQRKFNYCDEFDIKIESKKVEKYFME